ncbi:hypothetical protein ADL19_21415 [Streptomyces purpurogeneiscleroticus]|nr:hypothetical protein ADL19_21415 [Streptomyces purpurogeneiscleroticus]
MPSFAEPWKSTVPHAYRPLLAALSLLAGLCSAQAQAVTEPGMKGFEIRAVEGSTLPEMLGRCTAADRGEASLAPGETPALLAARCDQLRRSLRTQPGNTARGR